MSLALNILCLMMHRIKECIHKKNIEKSPHHIKKMGELSTPTSGSKMNNFRKITEILQSQIDPLP